MINNSQTNNIDELFGHTDGNDDILSDIGNTEEVRYMSALDPPKVGDGEEMNEIYDRNTADIVANKVAEKYQLGIPKYVGSGLNGAAYDIGDNKILKVTADKSEANESNNLIGKPLKYIANPYKVYSITPKSNKSIPETYVIILEKLKTNP